MTIKETINNANSKWLEGNGPDSDVVISSRVRLARNIDLVPFPHLLSGNAATELLHQVRVSLENTEVEKKVGKLEFMLLDELSPIERQILVEKHLVSPQFIGETKNKAIILRKDEAVCIMVNEEDHLRIQCLDSGLQIQEAWNLANDVDDVLEDKLDFAYSENKGYVTACPTNVGTGLRASVMLHLPGLVITNQIGPVLAAIGKLGLVVRGFYGEGTESTGNLYQISNQVTLGPSEEEIISNLVGITKQIITQERTSRETLYRENKFPIEDKVYRAYGILRNARILTSVETLQLMSDLRLGLDLGIIQDVSARTMNELMITTQPAFLQKLAGQEMNPLERDILRAQLLREKLSTVLEAE